MHKPQTTNGRRRRTSIDIGNAERKLRQANFFLSHLEAAPLEIAKDLARIAPDRSEILDFYFSACLSAAQSAFYTMGEADVPRFKAIESKWRNGLANDKMRARFNAMMNQRDRDVHYGETDADRLSAAISAEPHEYAYYVQHNASLLGPPALAKHTNPDGTEITAVALRGTKLLYLLLDGERVDAAKACRIFIEQLRSLQTAVMVELASVAGPFRV